MAGFKQMLTVEQVAEILNVSAKSVYRWVQKDEIEYVKVFNLPRFDPDYIQGVLTNGLQRDSDRNNISVLPKKQRRSLRRVPAWEK